MLARLVFDGVAGCICLKARIALLLQWRAKNSVFLVQVGKRFLELAVGLDSALSGTEMQFTAAVPPLCLR